MPSLVLHFSINPGVASLLLGILGLVKAGLLCAVLHQHPHISTVLYAHEIGNHLCGAKIHISLVFCIELMNQFP
jgi:hypothetical protein